MTSGASFEKVGEVGEGRSNVEVEKCIARRFPSKRSAEGAAVR